MDAIFEATQGRRLLVIMHGDSELHGRFDRVVDLTPPTLDWAPVQEAVG